MSGMLVFGNQEFIDEFFKKSYSIPIVGVANDMINAAEMLKTYPDAREVVVGFRNGKDFTFESAQLYRSKRFFLVLQQDEISAEIYRAALSCNVRIVERKVAYESINAELGRPPGLMNERKNVDSSVAAGIERELISKHNRPPKSGTVAITGIKGGVGKTVTAVAMSSYIADWARKKGIDYRVCLVDCDAEGARSAGIWLGIANAPQSLSVWASLEKEPSWMELENLLIRHDATGLYILPGPQSFRDAFSTELSASLAERIVNALRWHFDLVVLDLGAFVKNETAIRAMQVASKVFMVVEPTLTVLKLMEEMVKENTLSSMCKVDLSRVRLVLNMVDGSPFPKSDIERSFGIPVAASIALDKKVKQIENSGKCIPPTIAYPTGQFSKGIAMLARTAVESELIPVHKSRPWDVVFNLKSNLKLRLKRAQGV